MQMCDQSLTRRAGQGATMRQGSLRRAGLRDTLHRRAGAWTASDLQDAGHSYALCDCPLPAAHSQVPGKAPRCDRAVSAELGCVTPCIIVPGPWTAADLQDAKHSYALCDCPSTAAHSQVPGKAPPCDKAVSAELGCVTPCIIVPGPWTAADLEAVAEEIVSWLVHNAGHNCLKVEALITDASWPLRESFIAAVKCAPSLSCLHAGHFSGRHSLSWLVDSAGHGCLTSRRC